MNLPGLNAQRTPRSQMLPVVLILLGFGLRVYRLDYQSMWWDEIMTVARSGMTIPELIQNLIDSRTHLPLYFLLLQVWSEIGRSEFVLRYFSVMCGVLTIPLLYQTGRLLAGHPSGLLAAFLLAISPFHIWYSQEARMYTFLALNALAAHWFLLRLLRQETRRDWLGYTVTMTFTLLSHYLGVLILIAHYVFFSLQYRHDRTRFKHWFISAAIAGSAFAAWFLAVYFINSFTQAPISWIRPVHWYEPLATLLAFSVGRTINPAQPFYYLAFIAYCVPVLVVLFFRHRAAPDGPPTTLSLARRLLLIWLGVPLLFLTIISLDWSIPQQRFIYMDRYVISLLPALFLLAAWGIVLVAQQRWAKRWLLAVFMVAVLAPTIVSLRNLYDDPAYAREDWRAVVAQMAISQKAGDVLLLPPGQILPLWYYADADLPQIILPTLLEFEVLERETLFPQRMAAELSALDDGAQRAWLIEVTDNADTHGFPQTRNAAVASDQLDVYATWMGDHYPVIKKWIVTGIRLTLYDLQRDG